MFIDVNKRRHHKSYGLILFLRFFRHVRGVLVSGGRRSIAASNDDVAVGAMVFRTYSELDTLERLPMANARVIYKKSGWDKGRFKDIYFRREQRDGGFSDSTHDFILRMVAEDDADALRATDDRHK